MPSRRTVEPKTALSEGAIVAAALKLLAEQGVDGLTMRELSARLGVSLGATYRHVRSKHELLKLVTQDLYSRIEPGNPSTDGFEQAKVVMLQVHDLIGAYPGLAGYIGHHMGEFSSLPVSKILVDPLCDAGLKEEDAYRVIMALILFTSGHLLIRGSVPEWVGMDKQAMFTEGLDLLVDGARGRVRKPRVRRRERR
jgi:AcrR family transcriptional regulator